MNIIRGKDFKDFDFGRISFYPFKTDNGRTGVQIKIDETDKFLIQIPETYTPFGITKFTPKNTDENSKCSFSVNYEIDFKNEELKDFYDFIKKLEEHCKDYIKSNPKSLYGDKGFNVKKFNPESVDFAWLSCVNEENEKYPPFLRTKIIASLKETNPVIFVKCFDKKKNAIDWKEIEKGSKIIGVINIIELWVVMGKMGIRMNTIQIMKRGQRESSDVLIKVDDDDTEKDEEADEDEEEYGEEEYDDNKENEPPKKKFKKEEKEEQSDDDTVPSFH